eukprot:scaffold69579_cov70-Phaeocystis_antarctica.AAC.9
MWCLTELLGNTLGICHRSGTFPAHGLPALESQNFTKKRVYYTRRYITGSQATDTSLKVAKRRAGLHLGVAFEVVADEAPQHHVGCEPEVRQVVAGERRGAALRQPLLDRAALVGLPIGRDHRVQHEV